MDDKNVRWAISYYIDREQIIDVAWAGASLPSTLFVPDYPPLQPFLDAAQATDRAVPLPGVQPGQGRRTADGKGWTKDGNGMWQDESGQPVALEIISFFDFTCVGPVVVEQLKRAGIDATYAEPPNIFDRFSAGDYTGASSATAAATAPTSTTRCASTRPRRRRSPAATSSTSRSGTTTSTTSSSTSSIAQSDRDGQGHGHLDEVPGDLAAGIPGHPDLQGLHRLPTNTTYWTNWPDAGEPVRQHRALAPDLAAGGPHLQAGRPVVEYLSSPALLPSSRGEQGAPLPARPTWEARLSVGMREPRGASQCS